MRTRIARMSCLIAVVTGVHLAAVLPASGADANVPNLPGITSNDPYPQGCVSCHKGPLLLKNKLAALKHRNIDGKVNVIPDDCRSCHNRDSGIETLSEIAHSMHYAAGSKSDFVTKYQGSCLNCHQMATGTGDVSVKSGKRNW